MSSQMPVTEIHAKGDVVSKADKDAEAEWEKVKQTYTNHYNLPEVLVNALIGDGERWFKPRRISVTQLQQPPLIRQLMRRHAHEVEEDVSEYTWRLLGSAVHSVIERAQGVDANAFTEEKLTLEVDGWTISGVSDYLGDDGILTDFKVTSSWTFVFEGGKAKPEWIEQLNLYAHIWRMHGFDINGLRIIAILRDWSKGKAKAGKGYPAIPLKVVDVPLWDHAKAQGALVDRLSLHMRYQDTPIEEIPVCTPEERWAKSDAWAVMKHGRKSAVRVFDNETAAEAMLATQDAKHYIEHRPGEDVRCLDYCPVAKFCPYGSKLVGNGGSANESD